MGDQSNQDKAELIGVPTVCQYTNLPSIDKLVTCNESVDWLRASGHLPLWSRLKPTNCAGQLREQLSEKDKNYVNEIPHRLLSLFGSITQQMNGANTMPIMGKYQLLAAVLALVAALGCDFREWSEHLLDVINATAASQYADLLKKLTITDKNFKIGHLNQLLSFEGAEYKTQVQQVAAGFLYIQYGLNEFNLARALAWFFSRYQFGLLECNNRTLAFGRTLDTEYGFFMYDSQTRGYPLLKDQETAAYILRTPYLQILLYCLITSFNISTEKTKFVIYNVDIVIVNHLERMHLEERVYVPILTTSVENKQKICSDSALNKKSIANNNAASTTKNKFKKSETLISSESGRRIIMDASKMYFVIAVPKQSTTLSAKWESKHLLFSNATTHENCANADVKVDDNEFFKQNSVDSLHLIESANTKTLYAADTTPASVIKNSTKMGLRVYLVAESGETSKSYGKNKIQVAYQLRDFFETRI